MTAQTEWWELRLEVPADLADDLGATLIAAGAGGVQIRDETTVPPPLADAAPPAPLPAGTAEVIATYAGEERPSLAEAIEALSQLNLPAPAPDALRHCSDASWPDRWKEYFSPLAIGSRLWVVPSWEKERFTPPEGAICLTLDPGMAFGTGQHATTILCAELLELACADTPPATLLDVGCGSGILSIAASQLGVGRVVGIDIDPDAVTIARDNAAINGVDIELATTPVAELSDRYAWVIANILAPILISVADGIIARVEPSGTLILSGLLRGQRSEVFDAYRRAAFAAGRNLRIANEEQREEWVALVLRVD